MKGLQDLGIISKTINGKEDFEKIWESRISFYFFPHGLGHYIGINTHDLPGDPSKENDWIDYKNMSLRVKRKLDENMILSNEPGIYFNDNLLDNCKQDPVCGPLVNWDKLNEYKAEVKGVRIEDNFVVRKNGSPEGNYVNLTSGLPKKVEDIESWMGKKVLDMDMITAHL